MLAVGDGQLDMRNVLLCDILRVYLVVYKISKKIFVLFLVPAMNCV